MMRRNLRLALCVCWLLALAPVLAVHAQGGDPPDPIIVQTSVERPAKLHGRVQPNAVVSKGSWNMTIQNALYKYSNKVESDGWADANFNQPGSERIYCEASVINNDNFGHRDIGVSYLPLTYSSSGGSHCGTTPRAWLSYPNYPNWTGQTYVEWRWPDGSPETYELNNGPHQW